MRYVDSGDTDSGDTSGGEQLSAPWSDLLASGLVPALVWAGVAALLLWLPDMPWHDTLTLGGAGDAAALVLLTVVAVAVSFLGFRAARRRTGCGLSCSPRSAMTCAARLPRRRRR